MSRHLDRRQLGAVKSIGIAGVDLVQKQDSCDPEVGRTGSCQRYPGLDSLMFDVGGMGVRTTHSGFGLAGEDSAACAGVLQTRQEA